MDRTSITVARAAIQMAISESREKEQEEKSRLEREGIRAIAVDFGGQFIPTLPKIIEHAVMASLKHGIISDTHTGRGAIIGAVHEALEQLKRKAIGLNVGGKVGIARAKEHLSVAIFMGVGIMHLNEIALAGAHRSLPNDVIEGGK